MLLPVIKAIEGCLNMISGGLLIYDDPIWYSKQI